MAGYFIAGLAGIWIPLTPADHIVLAAVGMSSCLGAIVRAPLTSMLIVFEMTHQFSLVPGLMIGTIISQAMSRRAGKLNFYDALLVQDGHELHKIRPPLDLQSWQRLPISAVANPKPVGLAGLDEKGIREALTGIRFPPSRSLTGYRYAASSPARRCWTPWKGGPHRPCMRWGHAMRMRP